MLWLTHKGLLPGSLHASAESARMTPQYRQSFTFALTGHVLLIIAALVVSVVPGCLKPKPVDLPIDFIPLRTDLPLQRSTPTPKNPTPTPPAPEAPQAPREPDMPKDPLPPPPPDKPEPPVKTPEKPPEKAPEKDPLAPSPDHAKPPVNSKPAHTNVADVAHADHVPVKIGPKIKQTVLVPGALSHVRQPPRLSAADLAKALGTGSSGGGFAAPQGEYDSVPLDEKQRCLIMIRRALYNAWDQPAVADAGQRPAELEMHFDLSGRVTGYQITQPSGSDVFDRSVLLAAKAVPRVEGLSSSFLRAYARLTITFKLE